MHWEHGYGIALGCKFYVRILFVLPSGKKMKKISSFLVSAFFKASSCFFLTTVTNLPSHFELLLPHLTARTQRRRQTQTAGGWVWAATQVLKAAFGSLSYIAIKQTNQRSLPCGYKRVSHLEPCH